MRMHIRLGRTETGGGAQRQVAQNQRVQVAPRRYQILGRTFSRHHSRKLLLLLMLMMLKMTVLLLIVVGLHSGHLLYPVEPGTRQPIQPLRELVHGQTGGTVMIQQRTELRPR